MKSARLIVTFLAAALLIGGACAQKQVSENIDTEVAQQPSRPMHGGVAYKGMEAILASISLTADQKWRLSQLQMDMMAETFAIQEETSKLKGVLFETVTKLPYQAEKVAEIKKRLVALNSQKMNNMFRALNQTEKILGRLPPEQKQEIYLGLFFDEPRPQGVKPSPPPTVK